MSSTITLPNGQVMRQQEYLEKNNVLYWVPPTSMVTLKNGKVMTGEEFVNGVLERANKFNSFQDLILFYVKLSNLGGPKTLYTNKYM